MTVPIRTESGLLADWHTSSPETCVYRIYNVDDVLLYVGLTNNLTIRWSEHKSKPWWRVPGNRYDVRWYPTRDVAAAEEKQAIMTERPKYNQVYRHRPVEPRVPGTYSVREIAWRFRFAPKTVREITERPDFPHRLPGHQGARYSVDEVEEYFSK